MDLAQAYSTPATIRLARPADRPTRLSVIPPSPVYSDRHNRLPRYESLPTPKVGFVSLGCPKALVDSERIITRLRAEGYELSREHAGADVVIVNTCGFLDSAKQESLAAIGEALKENGRVIVTGCLGVEEDLIRATHPSVLAVTGPQQYESVVDAVHRAVPPQHDPFPRPRAGARHQAHAAALRLFEDFRGLQQPLLVLHHPEAARRSGLAPGRRRDARGRAAGEAGVKELLVISQDTSAYGVDIKYASSEWRGREVSAHFSISPAALAELGVWTRLHYVYPYPHVDERDPADGRGQDPALSRHSVPARPPQRC